MKNRDFIVTSLQPWDIGIGSTIKNTALEISKQNRVLYVSTPLDINTWLRDDKSSPEYRRRIDVLQGKASPIRQLNENMWILDCPFLIHSVNKFPTPIFNYFNRKNNLKIAKWILKKAAELGFKEYIHLIDNDLFRSRYLKEYLHPVLSIYYRRDYVIGFPYWRKHGPREEEALVRQSDIVMANSSYFAEELRPFNSNTHVINTGVKLDLYEADKEWTQPEDMKEIPLPIIGYTGAIIESRLNHTLLYEVVKKMPECSFVFVGPEDDFFAQHPMHQLSNTYFLGHKEVEELPRYIEYFNVCINPQIVNPITDGNYPLKIDEYLAMGKPVVATNTHTMRAVFSEHTHLANNAEEYIAALKVALTESDNQALREERIRFAHTHSWGHSVQTIYDAIEEYEASQNK